MTISLPNLPPLSQYPFNIQWLLFLQLEPIKPKGCSFVIWKGFTGIDHSLKATHQPRTRKMQPSLGLARLKITSCFEINKIN